MSNNIFVCALRILIFSFHEILYYSIQKIPRYLIIAGLLVRFVGGVLIGPPKFLTTP